jgi:hypothetical protein
MGTSATAGKPLPSGMTAQISSAGHQRQRRRQQVDHLVDVPRDDLLFEDRLHRIGHGLQQALGAGAVGAVAHMEARQQLALVPGQVRKAGQQHHDEHHRADDRDDEQVQPIHKCTWSLVEIGDWRLEITEIQGL